MAIAPPPPPQTEPASPAVLGHSPIRYRFRLLRWADWAQEGTPPVRNCTVQFPRNGIERVDASLGLQNGMPDIRTGAEQVLVVEQEEEPIAAAAIQDVRWSSRSAVLTLQTTGWTALLGDRQIEEDVNFTQIDQFDIVRALLVATQQDAGGAGDLHIDPWSGLGVTAPLSGVLRDRTYLAIDNKPVLEAIQQLSQVVGGFDFRLRPVWRDGWLRFWPVFDFPPGARRSAMVLEHKQGFSGSNVVDYDWAELGADVINRAKASNDEQTVAVEDATAWTRWPLRTGSIQEGGEHGATREDTLREHAEAYLLQNRRPKESGTLTLRSDLALTPDIVGSRVRFRATSWRHPPQPNGSPGFDEDVLVENLSISIGSDERATETKLEVSRLLEGDPRPRAGAPGGGGRMGGHGDLGAVMTQIRGLNGDVRQAQDLIARVEQDLNQVAIEANVTPPPTPAPPPPAPPPAPPPPVTMNWGPWTGFATGDRANTAQTAVLQVSVTVPRAGRIRVWGFIRAQPIYWANNEGYGTGSRRVWTQVVFGSAWWQQSARAMVGGGSPNWATTYTINRDNTWALPQAGTYQLRWNVQAQGGNTVRVAGGELRATYNST